MVFLVMVFSLLWSKGGVSFKTAVFWFYSRNGDECPKFPASAGRKVRPYWHAMGGDQ